MELSIELILDIDIEIAGVLDVWLAAQLSGYLLSLHNLERNQRLRKRGEERKQRARTGRTSLR
jgi:hypothetical protein